MAGVTASHYLDALEAAPGGEDTADLRRLAIDALLSAADRAGALQSHAQVVRLCLRGIDLAASPSERGELLIRAARAAHAALDSNAEAYARDAIGAFAEARDVVGRVRAGTEAVAQLARSFMLDARTEQGLEWCDRALTQAEDEDNIPVFVDTIITKGVGLGLSHRTREAVILLEAGLEMAREHQLMAQKRRVLQNLAYVTASDTPVREDLALEKLEDARRLGDPRNLTEVRLEWAWNQIFSFDFQEIDEILADIDPHALPLRVEHQYWNVAHVRTMWTEDPTAVLAERIALRERIAGTGDRQAVAGLATERIEDAVVLKQFVDVYEIARSELPPTPLRLDLWFGVIGAVMLSDRKRLSDTLELAEANPYRGRLADVYKHAGRGGLAAFDGDHAVAEAEWRRAHELAAECLPVALEGVMWALAGHSLGSSHPYGLESGRRAHALFSSAGVFTLLDAYSSGVFEPEEQAADTA